MKNHIPSFFLFLSLSLMVMTSIKAQVTVSTLNTENNKTFIKVNNIPFPIIGAQIRMDFLMNCDGKTIQQCQPFFVKAQELGVNCVQIPIWWKLIEPTQDNFSWSVLDQILTYLNQYNLKMELLWFSTNVCGESFSNYVPDYILNIPGIKLVRNDGCPYWDYYGYQYNLVLNDPTLLSRETNAVTTLMEHIRVWDNSNGSKHPVISVQVHNEPDAFARWRFDQKQIHYADNRSFTKQDAWSMTLAALNTVGNAVKNSNYKVVTRCNLITSSGLNSFPELSGSSPVDVYNLEGIDIAASDPYVTSVDVIKSNSLAFLSLSNHYPIVAENKGSYQNGASLLLTAISLGSGYNFYDLATSKYVIDHTSDPTNIDHGVYTWDLQDKSHTAKLKTMIKGLIKAYPDVATTKNDNFIAFNIQGDLPQTTFSQTVNSTKIRFSFNTTVGASGFSITKDNYILIYSNEVSQIQLFNATFSNAVKGYFDATGNFVSEGTVNLEDGYILNADKEVLYKISYTGSPILTSTAVNNIGTIPSDINNYGSLDFENETTSWSIIDNLHLDWQTNTSYTRNLFASNTDQTGLNKTAKCATFSGYNSDNEWWYGLDMVLKNSISLPTGNKYVHALMKSNITNVDMNKGCLNVNSSGTGIGETWKYVNSDWVDYVFPINTAATELKEMRFMLNHKTSGQITYVDEICISNSSTPRTADLASVSTNPITGITTNSATCGGNVSWNGNSAVTERGICWSTSPSPNTSNSIISSSIGTGQFTCNLTGLQPNTLYYARAYVKNMTGTAYGNQISFITLESAFLNFENEATTWSIVDQLHLDWQTNTAYTRDLYASNPDQTGLNHTTRCASFSGYYSNNEWWYGLDFVLKQSQSVSYGQYIHVLMKTNNTGVDLNRGLLLLNSAGTTLSETWKLITGDWEDYVFPIPSGATELKEMRFTLNHKAGGQITYIDQIVINNNTNPRTIPSFIKGSTAEITDSKFVKTITKDIIVFSGDKTINVITSFSEFDIEVYNMLGKLVFFRKVSGNQIAIPVNEKGIYLVKSHQFTKKVIVN